MADDPRSRRSALKTLAWVAAGAAGLWRYLTPRSLPGAAAAIAARSDEVPPDGALVLPQHGVALVRTGKTIGALDLACTHLGCMVVGTANGFACPCHGSRFSAGGEQIAGPASRPMQRLEVIEEGGLVRVLRNAGDDGREGEA